VADPFVGRLVLVPENLAVLLARNKIQIAVAVQVGKVGLTHVPPGQVAVAEVMAEADFPERHISKANHA
jgi:hypothetical protein